MMKKNKFLAIILLSFIVGLQAQTPSLSNYRWLPIEAKAEVVGRHENAFIEYKGKFYLLGGRGVNPVNVFDPQTNIWETKGKSPMEIHHFQAVVYGNAIYLVGAMTGGYPKELPLDCIWKYYPETDKWEKGAEIPVARRRGGAGEHLRRPAARPAGEGLRRPAGRQAPTGSSPPPCTAGPRRGSPRSARSPPPSPPAAASAHSGRR